MTIDQLIEKLKDFKKKNPALANQEVKIYLDAVDCDKNVVVTLLDVSITASMHGSFPAVCGEFDTYEDLS